MLASPCCMHGSLAFGCMLLCKGALHKFSKKLKSMFEAKY